MNSLTHPSSLPADNYCAYQDQELAFSISLLLTVALVVILRFIAKARRSVESSLDDWLITLALIIYAVIIRFNIKEFPGALITTLQCYQCR